MGSPKAITTQTAQRSEITSFHEILKLKFSEWRDM
jgi:hypothetical protein